MSAPSKEIMAFMEEHGVDSDEIWQTHGSSWVVKHKALERVAAEKAIAFDRPAIIEVKAAEKIAVVCVFGQLGERSEWSFGEAAPYNNKNAYPFAMAEKRAKDRVILKLLNAHGTIYSEAEADEFAESKQPPKQASGPISDAQADMLDKMLAQTKTDAAKFLKYFKAESLEDFPAAKFSDAVEMLKKKVASNV